MKVPMGDESQSMDQYRLDVADLWALLSKIISSGLYALALWSTVYYFLFLPDPANASAVGFVSAGNVAVWGLLYAFSALGTHSIAACFGAVGLNWRMAARINIQTLLLALGLCLALEGCIYLLGHLLWMAVFWGLLVFFPSGVIRAPEERSASDDRFSSTLNRSVGFCAIFATAVWVAFWVLL